MVFFNIKTKMAIHYSVLISLVFTAALSALFWEMPVQNLKAAIGYGALKGLWPIVIVILGAIFSYNVMQATKALDILRDILASISEDKRIQVLLISWCFGGFLKLRRVMVRRSPFNRHSYCARIQPAEGGDRLSGCKYRSHRIRRGRDPGFYSGGTG